MSAATDFGDWLAITGLKARYCRLLDTKDWAGWAALFTADLVLDTTGSGGYRTEGRDAALVSVRRSIETVVTVHHVHSPEIEMAGETASAIWAMQDWLTWPDGRTLAGNGHYHEIYRREGGAWKIAESRLTRLSLKMTPAAGTAQSA
jgi:hypothetical protein